MKETELGKIESVRFGFGGYQGCQFGLFLGFHGDGWCSGTQEAFWDRSFEITKSTQWTEKDRSEGYLRAMDLLQDTLRKAKKDDISQLVGVPVEVVFEDRTLHSWRVLEEVL